MRKDGTSTTTTTTTTTTTNARFARKRVRPGHTRVVYLDVDGTIIDHAQRLAPSVARAVRGAREAGHFVFVCTGRSRSEILGSVVDIGFDGFISAGGGFIEHDGELLDASMMAEHDVRELVAFFRGNDIEYTLQAYDDIYPSEGLLERLLPLFPRERGGTLGESTSTSASESTTTSTTTSTSTTTNTSAGASAGMDADASSRVDAGKSTGADADASSRVDAGRSRGADAAAADDRAAQRERDARMLVERLTHRGPPPMRGIAKATFLGTDPGTFATVRDGLGDRFHVVTGTIPYLGESGGEVSLRGMDKGSAIVRMTAALGLPMSASIAIGDSMNDLEMLERAGLGIAMGGSPPDVVARADEVTSSVHDDGVWRAFVKHGLIDAGDAARSPAW